MSELSAVIEMLGEVSKEDTIPKNIQHRLLAIIGLLQTAEPLRLSQAKDALEELSNEQALEGFTRTQLFNAMSLLE